MGAPAWPEFVADESVPPDEVWLVDLDEDGNTRRVLAVIRLT